MLLHLATNFQQSLPYPRRSPSHEPHTLYQRARARKFCKSRLMEDVRSRLLLSLLIANVNLEIAFLLCMLLNCGS